MNQDSVVYYSPGGIYEEAPVPPEELVSCPCGWSGSCEDCDCLGAEDGNGFCPECKDEFRLNIQKQDNQKQDIQQELF